MKYEDFDKPIPFLVERVKIKMAVQEVDFFDYIDTHNRPPLLNKSYLISPESPTFKAQRSLELRLGKLLGADLRTDLNLSRQRYDAALKENNKCVIGFRVCNLKA